MICCHIYNSVSLLQSVCVSLILIVQSACDYISEAPWRPLEKVFLVSGAKALIVHRELCLCQVIDSAGFRLTHQHQMLRWLESLKIALRL